MKKIISRILSVVLLTYSVMSFSSSIVTDSNGILTGFSDVIIQGTSYSGTLHEFYDETHLQSESFALAASNVLLDMFNSPPIFEGVYDFNKDLIFGCESNTHCHIATPYNLDVSGNSTKSWSFLNNYEFFNANNIHKFNGLLHGNYDNLTVVEWTATSTVPVPAAVWMFGTGLIGLLGVSKRKAH